MTRIAIWLFGLAIAGSFSAASPVPDEDRVPVDLRRTTLVVRDIDRSLPLYRDALGLRVIYDELIGGGAGVDGKRTPPTVRLVLLRANDTFVGVLGLMQRLDVEPPQRAALGRVQAGGAILVFNAPDLETRFAKIRATAGVTIDTAPQRVEYPRPGGGSIHVLFSSIYDPDGFFIEINKLLDAPATGQ